MHTLSPYMSLIPPQSLLTASPSPSSLPISVHLPPLLSSPLYTIPKYLLFFLLTCPLSTHASHSSPNPFRQFPISPSFLYHPSIHLLHSHLSSHSHTPPLLSPLALLHSPSRFPSNKGSGLSQMQRKEDGESSFESYAHMAVEGRIVSRSMQHREEGKKTGSMGMEREMLPYQPMWQGGGRWRGRRGACGGEVAEEEGDLKGVMGLEEGAEDMRNNEERSIADNSGSYKVVGEEIEEVA